MNTPESILVHYPSISGIHPACLAVPPISKEDYDSLVDDIRANGLHHPILLTKDGQLLDGRSRLSACFDANVDIKVERLGQREDPWTVAASLNIARRHLTVGQKAMFGAGMMEHLEEEARKRQEHHGGTAPGRKSLVATLPQVSGKSRDQAAKKTGVGAKSIDAATTLMKNAPDLAAQVQSAELPIFAAMQEYRKRKESSDSMVAPVESKPTPPSAVAVGVDGMEYPMSSAAKPHFNKTNANVDWAAWTWNPVTGCDHGCDFCYARAIAISSDMKPFYPAGFAPVFHENRLVAPKNSSIPKEAINDPRLGRVFVCSMADLFGKWVPKDWIEKVFQACLESPEWEYMFLTKWPKRYSQMPLIPRAWYGASMLQQSDVIRVETAMAAFEAPGCVKWLSIEPLLGPIKFGDISWCDLIVIGSQTSTLQPWGQEPEFAPDFEWVIDIVAQARAAGVPYYLKDNLGLMRPGMVLPKMLPK